MDWSTILLEWGIAGIVLVVVWVFINYIQGRDKDLKSLIETNDRRHAEKDQMFVSSLKERDNTLAEAMDDHTKMLRKLDETIIRLDAKSGNNHNHIKSL